MNENLSFRIGPIRPPSEADSLLIQVTRGCTWNKCKFCQLYRHTQFKAYSADSIKADIDNMVVLADRVNRYRKEDGNWDIDGLNYELGCIQSDEERQSYYMIANWLVKGGKNVFLQDGNTTVLKGGRLSDVLRYLKQAFPNIERITSYGRAENLSKTSAEEFVELKDAGLDSEHAKECMKLMYSDGKKCGKCLEILKKQRSRTLDEIHALEKQLENTDCLIYKLKKQIKE